MVAGMSIATAVTLLEDAAFQSSMRLLVEPNYRQTVSIPTQRGNVDSRALSQTAVDYATQLNLMRSQEFIEQTVEALMAEYPDLCRETETWAACIDGFEKSFSLSPILERDVGTRIFEAEFSSGDPKFVQAFLQTLGNIYLTYNVEQQEQRLEEGLALVNQQIEDVQVNLAASRQQLKQFQESENLIDPQQQASSVGSALTRVEQTRLDVENQYQAAQAQLAVLQQQLVADPQVALTSSRLSQSTRYQQLLNALQETELALEQRRAIYTDADAGVQDLISQRQGQVDLLRSEVTRVLGGIPPQIGLDESSLLREGQLGETDIRLINDLVQTQVELQGLAARRESLAQAAQELQAELNEFPGLIAEYSRIQPEIATQQVALEQLLVARQELTNQLAQGGFKWDIVEAPAEGEKISPLPKRNLMLGLVAGVFVGGALAFGREALDNVVRTSDELKKQTSLPLLGVIPEMPDGAIRELSLMPGQSSAQASSLMHYPPFRDAVDLIYKTIQLSSTQPLSSLMVTSALVGEGKTTLAIGLALTAARLHQRVLLIDTDLRNPSLHDQLGISNYQGLSTLLETSRATPSPIPLSLAGATIDIIPAGPTPDDPVRLLSSQSMQQLLASAEAAYDLVIIDTPVLLGSADVLQLASLCKAGVMVSRLDRVTQDELTQATSVLSNINMVGVVANKYRDNSKLDATPLSDNSSFPPPSQGKAPAWNALQFAIRGALPWKKLFTASSVGAGIISVPILPEAESTAPKLPAVQAALPAATRIKSKAWQWGSLAMPSMETGVTSIHVPQWS